MTCPDCEALAKAIDAFLRKEQDDVSDEMQEAGYLDAEDSAAEEQSMEDGLAEAMNSDTEAVAEELSAAESVEEFVSDTWETMQEVSALADDVRDVFQHGFKSLIPRLVNSYLHDSDMGLLGNMISAATSHWMDDWSGTLAGLCRANYTDRIGKFLSDALSKGDGVEDAARKLLEDGIYENFWRARQTALTEMLTAHSVAREEALQQSPSVNRKEWRHSGSRHNKPRKNHVAMDGMVVDKAEPFELVSKEGNVYHPMYPRDTNLPPGERINCHCLHRGVVDDNILGLPLSERRSLQQQAIDRLNARGELHKAESPVRKSVNDVLPEKLRGPLKPTRRGFAGGDRLHQQPHAVIDVRECGGVSRYIYDDAGRLAVRVDNGDHGFPRLHPHGRGGAHYVTPVFDDAGNFGGWSRNRTLTLRLAAACADILPYTTRTVKGGAKR